MRPIDADALIQFFQSSKNQKAFYTYFTTTDIIRVLDNATTLTLDDLRPKGEWIWIDGDPCCNHCGCTPAYWEAKPQNEKGLPPYCHSCGRKMKGGGE